MRPGYVTLTDIRGRQFTICPLIALHGIMVTTLRELESILPPIETHITYLKGHLADVRAIVASNLSDEMKVSLIERLEALRPEEPQLLPSDSVFSIVADLLFRGKIRKPHTQALTDGDGI